MDQKIRTNGLFFTEEEKLRLAKEICEIYSSGKYTLDSICNSKSISHRTLLNWVKGNSEIASLYKKAKQKKREERRGDLLEIAETSFVRRLQGWATEETIMEGIPNENGEVTRKRMKKVRKIVPPDSTLIIYALKIANPKKYVQSDIPPEDDGKGTLYDYSKLTPDELRTFEKIIDKLSKSDT